jgi:hypothetical protein
VIDEPLDEDDEGEEPRVVVGDASQAFERMTSAPDMPYSPDNGTLVVGFDSLSSPHVQPEGEGLSDVPYTPAPPLPFEDPSLPPPAIEAVLSEDEPDETPAEDEVYSDFSTAPTEFASGVGLAPNVDELLGMMIDETPAAVDEPRPPQDIGDFDTIAPSIMADDDE